MQYYDPLTAQGSFISCHSNCQRERLVLTTLYSPSCANRSLPTSVTFWLFDLYVIFAVLNKCLLALSLFFESANIRNCNYDTYKHHCVCITLTIIFCRGISYSRKDIPWYTAVLYYMLLTVININVITVIGCLFCKNKIKPVCICVHTVTIINNYLFRATPNLGKATINRQLCATQGRCSLTHWVLSFLLTGLWLCSSKRS